MIDLCLLGCGGGMPMPFRNLSATLINIEGRKILIDCGEGTQVSMRMVGAGFKTIDIICITHAHGDHIIGLPGLLSTIGNSGRTAPLTIVGPDGICEVVKGLMVLNKYLPYEVNIIENPKGLEFDIGKDNINLVEKNGRLVLKTLECDHSSPCLGYMLDLKRYRKFSVEKAKKNNVPQKLWNILQKEISVEYEGRLYNSDLVLGDNRKGIKISVITDSRPFEEIIKFIEGSNLFICEGTYGSDEDIEKAIKNKHMTFSEAALIAKEAKVNKLLLTHFSPAMINPIEYIENATKIFRNTIVGEDRLKLNISYEE